MGHWARWWQKRTVWPSSQGRAQTPNKKAVVLEEDKQAGRDTEEPGPDPGTPGQEGEVTSGMVEGLGLVVGLDKFRKPELKSPVVQKKVMSCKKGSQIKQG